MSKNTATAEPIAVIGLGCLFPKAQNVSEYWHNIKEGIDCITDIPQTHWKLEDYFDDDPRAIDKTFGRRGGFLDTIDFPPLEYGIAPRDIEATDTTQLLGLMITKQALDDAGYTGKQAKEFSKERTSVILGVTGTLELVIPLGARLGHPIWRKALKDAGISDQIAEDVVERIRDQYVPWQENSFPGLLGNVVAGRIANRFDLQGSNCVVDAACASSLGALHMAVMELRSNRSDMVVTGGLDTFNDVFMYVCFSRTPALSPSNETKPFDKNSDGMLLGEGLGAIVLKRLSDAEKDGDKIYAVIRSIGSSSDGKGNAIYAPSSDGQARAVQDAYQQVQISPETIQLVEAHGTGTRVGDITEVKGLSTVYGGSSEKNKWCAIGSVKSQIGHTKAAAGTASLIKTIMSLKNKTLPPTIKVKDPNPIFDDEQLPFYINASKRPWIGNKLHPRRAAVSSFGFGGSNFHTLLEEYEKSNEQVDWDGLVEIYPMEASDKGQLIDAVTTVEISEDWSIVQYQSLQARKNYSAKKAHRLVIVLEKSGTSWTNLKTHVLKKLADNEPQWNLPMGVFYGSGSIQGKVAAVFPGQGAQYTGMLKDLACQFPEFSNQLQLANETLNYSVSDVIYPIYSWDDEEVKQQTDTLTETQNAQPAIGAISIAAYDLLKRFGLQFQASCGHSYGELVALCAAGRISTEALMKISRLRGELMAAGDGDRGSMLAVMDSLAHVEAFIEKHQLNLIIANKNAPKQMVLSGATDEIKRAVSLAKQDGLRAKELQVAAAFHSELVSDASVPFRKELETIPFSEGAYPVYANSNAQIYPTQAKATRDVLGNQLAQPVEFIKQIEQMYADGFRTFVEIGPGKRLTGLIANILKGKDSITLSLDSSAGKQSGQFELACLLSQLWSMGYAIQGQLWNEGVAQKPVVSHKPVLTVSLSGANHKEKRPQRPPLDKIYEINPVVIQRNNEMSEKKQSAQTTNIPPEQENTVSTIQIQETRSQPTPESSNAAIAATQESLAALVKMQEQTAQVHQAFLLGQQKLTESFQAIMLQQQSILTGQDLPVANTIQAVPAKTPDTVPVQAITEEKNPSGEQLAPQVIEQQERPISPVIDIDQEKIKAIIAEKTGYPVEMLTADMKLDSDLGIDSIKRVEIFSNIQESWPHLSNLDATQINTIATIGELADLVEAQTSETQPALDVEPIFYTIIAEKTGYPIDMLESHMSLDGDLGIDSIKRVEILSALQEQVTSLPEIQADQIANLGTLSDIIQFLNDSLPHETNDQTITTASQQATMVAASNDYGCEQVSSVLKTVIAEKTGYPVEMIEDGMRLDADLGIDSIKRVEILSSLQEKMPQLPEFSADQMNGIDDISHLVDMLCSVEIPHNGSSQRNDIATQSTQKKNSPISSRIERFVLKRKKLNGDYGNAYVALSPDNYVWVTKTDDGLDKSLAQELEQQNLKVQVIDPDNPPKLPKRLSGLILVTSNKTQDDAMLKKSFSLLRLASSALKSAAQESNVLLASISRMDGSFGLGEGVPSKTVISAGLAGLIKSMHHEWSEVFCRAIDLDHRITEAAQGAKMLGKWLLRSGPVELGIDKEQVWELQATNKPLASNTSKTYAEQGVFVMTGGARGVTAQVAQEFALQGIKKIALIGRTKIDTLPDWFNAKAPEAEIKKAIMHNSSKKMSPVELQRQFNKYMAITEVQHNIEQLSQLSVSVEYYQADVTQNDEIQHVIANIVKQQGPITGVVHGAGVLADGFVENKTDQDFARVYDTKVLGLRNVLHAINADNLQWLVLFSSTTARFGRKGQADYAAANEVLNKMAQEFSKQHKTCRVVSVNWGPWEGGMVTPSLAKVFKQEGIPLIDLQAGANYLTNELLADDTEVETVVMGPGAVLDPLTSHMKFSKRIPTANVLPIVFEQDVSMDSIPVLKDHVFAGRPVVPVVILLEWLAQGAMHGNPGLKCAGIEDFRVLKGITLDKVKTIKICAGQTNKTKQGWSVETEICSGGNNGDRIVHAKALVQLANALATAPTYTNTTSWENSQISFDQVYSNILFHGEQLQGLKSIEGWSPQGIQGITATAQKPNHWMKKPLRSKWVLDPLAIDVSFQLMILWHYQQNRQVSLPVYFKSYEQYRDFPVEGCHIVIENAILRKGKAVADIYWMSDNMVIAHMKGYECVIDSSLSRAFHNNKVRTNEVHIS